MASDFSWLRYAPLEIALKATGFALFTIGALILFIWARRTYRGRYFARRDARGYALRRDWARIVSLEIVPDTWREKALDRELVETMLLDEIDVAGREDLPSFVRCLRESGLLDRYIFEARTWTGWKRQRALLKLGRTRASQAIPALAEALDSSDLAVVTAALRGLGRMGVPTAAIAILDRLAEGTLVAPVIPLKHALVDACRKQPSIIVPYLHEVKPAWRDLLAQALGQIASPELAEDLAVLAGDSSPEVRAAAARALSGCRRDFAIGILFTLVLDEVWFVRLRAVASLGQLHDPGTIESLVHSLCDNNRVVRQRAAMALVPFETESGNILKEVIATRDKFALHSFVSELQRHGRYSEMLRRLQAENSETFGKDLVEAAEAARHELRQKVSTVVL
jgi:HEAT repeat protein